mmetsp:Transcript_36459/g.64083  ORF Transcript_36459/g.64083 Transcript_36459/m.64083 type:complete len:234 (+) Transcript_36459:753-1454(+)
MSSSARYGRTSVAEVARRRTPSPRLSRARAATCCTVARSARGGGDSSYVAAAAAAAWRSASMYSTLSPSYAHTPCAPCASAASLGPRMVCTRRRRRSLVAIAGWNSMSYWYTFTPVARRAGAKLVTRRMLSPSVPCRDASNGGPLASRSSRGVRSITGATPANGEASPRPRPPPLPPPFPPPFPPPLPLPLPLPLPPPPLPPAGLARGTGEPLPRDGAGLCGRAQCFRSDCRS